MLLIGEPLTAVAYIAEQIVLTVDCIVQHNGLKKNAGYLRLRDRIGAMILDGKVRDGDRCLRCGASCRFRGPTATVAKAIGIKEEGLASSSAASDVVAGVLRSA